jgi:hypothetical protein
MLAYLKSKVFYYEKTVESLEKERANLQVRTKKAEERLKIFE